MNRTQQIEMLKQFRSMWTEVFGEAVIERAIARTRKRFAFHGETPSSYPPAAYLGELEVSLNEVIQ